MAGSCPIVTISIHAEGIFCSWFEKTNQQKPFAVKAYYYYAFDHMVYKNLIIYNIDLVASCITNFITDHHLFPSFVSLSLAGHGFLERVIGLIAELPQEHHLRNDHQEEESLGCVWDYQRIGHHVKSGKTYYYICGIAREILFQYQLLALMTNMNIVVCVPDRVALLAACDYFFSTFSLASLTNHASLQNAIDFCADQFNPETYCASLPNTYKKEYVMESLGLFLLGLRFYE